MKKLLLLLIVLVMATSFIACNSNNEDPQTQPEDVEESAPTYDWDNPSGKLLIWGWWSEIDSVWTEFTDKYENVEIEYVYIKLDDYFTKLQQTAASGLELPDVIFIDMQYRSKTFELGILEQLDVEPYNYDQDRVLEFTHAQNVNSEGQVLSIPWDIATGGIVVNNILAEQYLGTTDKDELSAMLSDWESIMEVGKQVKEDSNGEVWTFTTYSDITDMLFTPNISKLVQEDGSVGITPFFAEIFPVVKDMIDAEIVNLNKFADAGFLGSFAANDTLMWAAPIWMKDVFLQFDPEAPEGKYTLIKAPEIYISGGTSAGISAKSENKELAYLFLEWYLLSEEGAEVNTYLVSSKAAYENEDYGSITMSIFGDQDIGKMYSGELAENAPVMPLTLYDSDIQSIISDLVVQLTQDTSLTVEQLTEMGIQEFRNRYPDIPVK